MASVFRLTALALARAMLAGPPTAAGLAARMRACLNESADWQIDLAARVARWPGEHWRRLTVRSLADVIQRDTGFEHAWRTGARPRVQRYILRPGPGMQPLPLGLDHCRLPAWPDTPALARGLAITEAGLWRLSRSTAWQRRAPLVEQHHRYQLLPKRSGGWRLLEVPEPYLKTLQRRLLDELLDRVPTHAAACGSVRGRSLLDHARAHSGQAVVLRFDLQDFYSSVRAARVHALFSTLGYPWPVATALTALCTTATPEPVLRRLHENGGLSWPQMQRLRDAHLAQGAPTSPALANLCAFRLDLRLDGLAFTLGARYTRYADDLVLSGGAHLQAARLRIEAWVARIARDEGFTLNHRKSRCLGAGRRHSVCHVVVNQHPNLPRPDFDRLKAVLHQCVRDGPSVHNRDGLPHWRQHLQGRVAWAAQLNPAKAQRLQQLFERIDWQR